MPDFVVVVLPGFSAELYDDGTCLHQLHVELTSYVALGFEDITNIDFSPSAIEINTNRFKEKKKMEWHEMDMCEMPDTWTGLFDTVVDKGGSDTVFVGDDTPDDVTKTLQEVSRYIHSCKHKKV